MSALMFGIIFGIFSVPTFVHALAMSPPEFWVESDLDAGDTVSFTVAIGRTPNEIGPLFINVVPHGPCNECISGDNAFVIASEEYWHDYTFTVSAEDLIAGDYAQYIAFYLYSEPVPEEGGEGSIGMSVRSGVTPIVHFTTTGTAPSIDAGGGGGSSSPVDVGDETVIDDEVIEDAQPDSGSIIDIAPEASSSSTLEDSEPLIVDKIVVADVDEVTQESEVYSVPILEDIVISDSTRITIDEYFGGRCTLQCDVNGDGQVSFLDVVVQYAYLQDDQFIPSSGIPPIAVGPPRKDDGVDVQLIFGKAVGKYDIVLASKVALPEDVLTIYALINTGPVGILATEFSAVFDPSAMRFIGMDTVGSIFTYTNKSYAQSENGIIHFGGVAQGIFAGTNGYLAAFHFQPIREGSGSLKFKTLSVYHRDHSLQYTSNEKDFIGIFSLKRSSSLPLKPDVSLKNVIQSRIIVSMIVTGIFVLILLLIFILCRKRKHHLKAYAK